MKRASIVAAVMAVGASLLAVAPAAEADTEVLVYKNQIIQPDTRSAGHISWPIGGGIRMITDDTSSQAKATFAFQTGANGGPLDGGGIISHDVSVKSGGDQAIPGVQVYLGSDTFDTTPGALLVYEEVYGNDLWLPNGQPDAYKMVAPSCDGDPGLLTDPAAHCVGGGGSYYHGSQLEWDNALSAAGLDHYVSALGESLGSGVKGNVLVSSITQGTVTYEFTRANAVIPDPEPTVVNPVDRLQGTLTATCRKIVIHVELPNPGPNEVYSTNSVRIRVGNSGVTVPGTPLQLAAGSSYDNTLTYAKGSGSAVVRVLRSQPEVLFKQLAVNKNCNTVGAGPVTTA